MTEKQSWDHIRWDFTDIYTSETDPQLQEDIKICLQKMVDFSANFKGKLATQLSGALTAFIEITEYENKILGYLQLGLALNTEDEALRKLFSQAQEKLASTQAEHLTFFDHEINALDENTYQTLLKSDDIIAHHKPYLDQIRKYKPYYLDENVEAALAARSPFGPSAWDDYTSEATAALRFTLNGKNMNLEEILNVVASSQNRDERIAAHEAVNTGLKPHTKLAARALNVCMGAKMTEDAQRGYTHPMHARNLDNQVDDATVEALHTAVKEVAAPLAKRFYKLKAKLLGLEKLHWADRNAPLPFADDTIIPWEEGFNTVKQAFADFSPTLHEAVLEVERQNGIDAPTSKGKRGGAFCCGLTLPGGKPWVTVFLNHLGKGRDFATLAHEFGHAVHDMVAIPHQGVLQWHAPMVYAETASIFAEMLAFEKLKTKAETPAAKAAMLAEKCSDFLNTVNRQICFSEFEQRIHAARKNGSLTIEDFNQTWMNVTTEFYGEDGDVFEYSDMENLWCYVSHFFSPFYVYAYSFGELFTQSLYAVKDNFGDDFEPMYLNLLRAGGTKNAVELMEPFGLNPNDPTFWQRGIEGSLGVWLDELETLVQDL